MEKTSELESFTIVFEGDISKLDINPFKVESLFGKVIAVGVGNAFEEVDELTEQLEKIEEARK